MVNVNVKMPTGKTIKLSISDPYTIESVKQEISKEEGIPPHCQQLTFAGRVLEDGHTLNYYNIEYESTIDLVVRQRSKYMTLYLVFVVCATIYVYTNLPVFIPIPRKATLFLETQPSYTIGHIKTMIQEKQGILPEKLKLRFADQLLEDGHMLSDYNIQDGSNIYIGRMNIRVQLIFYPLQILESQQTLVSSEFK